MLLLKRVICGIVALVCILVGIKFIQVSLQTWQAFGFCIFVGGITLAYIAVMQRIPNYNFWITLTAIGLAYALYTTKYDKNYTTETQLTSQSIENELEEDKMLMEETAKVKEKKEKKKKKKKKSGINLSAYPKISGSADVLSANVFYIDGRYVRLFGTDAPDNDQVCSDARGASYNCGEEAISWVRGWIDNNVIDCYLLKVEPNGQDLATCSWGEYDIGAGLVASGWAIANTNETDIYAPYEVKARSEYAGLWQGTFYSPQDWRDIKRRRNDFTIKRSSKSKAGSFFNFKSWF